MKLVGFQGGGYDPEEEASIVNTIEKSRPSILLLGMDSPLQEQFLCRHWHRLKNAGVAVAISGGEAIDAIAGTLSIAPRLARALHLEWFLRMLLDPWRFYLRYLRGGGLFFWYLMKQKGKAFRS